MSFLSIAAKNVVLRTVGPLTVAVAALVTFSLTNGSFIRAQSPHDERRAQPRAGLPDEAAGIDGIVRALIATFDQADIVALGEWHGRIGLDSDLRLALVRHPDFAKRVRSVVIECGSVTEQSTLDRYIRGENVPVAQLENVWKATAETTNGFCDAPAYADFLTTVRDVNSRLPAEAHVRVFGGHPGPGANHGVENTIVSVLNEQVLRKHGKALVVFGAAHFYRTLPAAVLSSMGDDTGISGKLETEFPGRTLVVIPVGPLDPPRGVTADINPDFKKFDRALNTRSRPVLISLQRLPFRDFKAEEFLGRTMTHCGGPDGCVSAFKDTTLTLGQMADACVYVGGGTEVDTKAKPAR